MTVPRSLIFIVIVAFHAHWVSPNPASQKSGDTRATADSKAKLVQSRTNSKKAMMIVPTPFLPPTQSVSMKKIGVHLKSSKPKTFAFSSHRFSFRAPVVSQSNLQLRTKPDKTVPRREVFAKQVVKHYEPSDSKTVTLKMAAAKTKISNTNSKTIDNKETDKTIKLSTGSNNNPSYGKTEPEKSESTISGVTSQAIIQEQRRRQSRLGFSLQRVQSKAETDSIIKEKAAVKNSTKKETAPALSMSKNAQNSESENTENRKWMDKLKRSDAVQTPVWKEPTPQKSFSAKALRKTSPRPLKMSSRMAVKVQSIPASQTRSEDVIKSTRQQTTESINISKSQNEVVPNAMKSTENTQLRQNSLIDKEPKRVSQSDVKTDLAKQLPLNIPLPPGEIFDGNLFMKATENTQLRQNSLIDKEPNKVSQSDVKTDLVKQLPLNIPLPPGEIFDRSLILKSNQLKVPIVSEVKPEPESNPLREVVLLPPQKTPKQTNLINSIQRLEGKTNTALNTEIYPQTVPKLKALPQSLITERPIPSTLNQNIILPKSLQMAQDTIKASGIGIGVSLPGSINQQVPGVVPLRPASIPPPPPDDFVGGRIPRPPGPWTNPIQRPLLPPSSLNKMASVIAPMRQSPNRVVQRNYIQTKVPLSGVIPQPPGVMVRENRIPHPRNIRPFSQQHSSNTAYLTKAPNKQNVQGSRNPFVSRTLHQTPNRPHGRQTFDMNHSRNQHQQTPQRFIDVTVPYDVTPPQPVTTTRKPVPGPRRKPPKPRNFDPLKHIMKGKQEKVKKAKKPPVKARKPPEPPEQTTSGADPERKNFNQKIFKNSFQKDYVNEQRGRHPLRDFMSEFERFMKNMDSFFDLSGMMEFKR
ncbi:uncharacterized protein LOC111110974 [Crassostrea virginica]